MVAFENVVMGDDLTAGVNRVRIDEALRTYGEGKQIDIYWHRCEARLDAWDYRHGKPWQNALESHVAGYRDTPPQRTVAELLQQDDLSVTWLTRKFTAYITTPDPDVPIRIIATGNSPEEALMRDTLIRKIQRRGT
jgi:hypothetical protein